MSSIEQRIVGIAASAALQMMGDAAAHLLERVGGAHRKHHQLANKNRNVIGGLSKLAAWYSIIRGGGEIGDDGMIFMLHGMAGSRKLVGKVKQGERKQSRCRYM